MLYRKTYQNIIPTIVIMLSSLACGSADSNQPASLNDSILLLQECEISSASPNYHDSLNFLIKKEPIKYTSFTNGKAIDVKFFDMLLPYMTLLCEDSDKTARVSICDISSSSMHPWIKDFSEDYENQFKTPPPHEMVDPVVIYQVYDLKNEALTKNELKRANTIILYDFYINYNNPHDIDEYVMVEHKSFRFLLHKEYENVLFKTSGTKTFINSTNLMKSGYKFSTGRGKHIILSIENYKAKIHPSTESHWQ